MDIHRKLYRVAPKRPVYIKGHRIVVFDPYMQYEKRDVIILAYGSRYTDKMLVLNAESHEEDPILVQSGVCDYLPKYPDDSSHHIAIAQVHDHYQPNERGEYDKLSIAGGDGRIALDYEKSCFHLFISGQYPSATATALVEIVAGYSCISGETMRCRQDDEIKQWFRKTGRSLLSCIDQKRLSHEQFEELIAIYGRPGTAYYKKRSIVKFAVSGLGNVTEKRCDACGRRRFVSNELVVDEGMTYAFDATGAFFYGIGGMFPCSDKCAKKLYGWFLFRTREEIKEERSWRRLHELQKRARQALKENDREALLSLHREYERLVTSRT